MKKIILCASVIGLVMGVAEPVVTNSELDSLSDELDDLLK